jgi:hypothetical protein
MNKKSTLVIWAIVIAVVFFGAGWGIKELVVFIRG